MALPRKIKNFSYRFSAKSRDFIYSDILATEHLNMRARRFSKRRDLSK
jgi:hypothetical protein